MDSPKTITHLSLCSGYGGIDLGLKRVLPTLRTIAYVEIEAFAIANLVAKMEEGQMDPAPIWTDLKTLPLECIPKGTDILSGGFPCQPFSQAGNREGDEDPRHLFPYIKNAIRTIQPRLVFIENVEGIISAKLKGDGWDDPAGTPVLLHVLRELERVGYKCAWGVFSAAEIGAPHQRKRVFILAHARREHREVSPGWELSAEQVTGGNGETRRAWPARPGEHQHEWEEPRVVGDTKGGQVHSRESGEAAQGGEGESATVADPSAELADTSSGGQQECGEEGNGGASSEGSASPVDAPKTGANDGDAEHETQPLMGGATPGTRSGVDATANRVDRLRLLGNGVVPDTCEVAFRTLYKELCEKD